ncbi:MAG: PfkB family carbohydrate kinase [Bacteroidales bacterium]|nr:PfkB family carbohydrate kinase [Bacteroidales bacterium]
MEFKRKDISELIKQFTTKRVLIIGDVMVDSYMWGKVNRISPEAPIPVVSVTGREYRLGGAANVALNIKSLGAEPILCSVIGDDDKALVFSDLLKQNSMCADGLVKLSGRKTTTKTRIISGSQHLLRVDDEIDTALENSDSDILVARIKELCSKSKIDLIIFEDYDKGVLTDYNLPLIIEFAKSMGIVTAVDPKKRNFMNYRGVNLFKPNHKEFCEGTKSEIAKNDFVNLKTAGEKFLAETGNQYLLLTLSEHGVYITDNKSSYHQPAVLRDISDVSGAGDTVISVAGLLLCAGADMETIATISNIAGGLVCEKAGVVPVNPHELILEFPE